jgi:diphthamide synthase (EF-2-diphthine--ammonia ligase)
MQRAGMKSVVVKVAGMGLNEKNLGVDVCDDRWRARMKNLVSEQIEAARSE